jgi:hypothetical protein
MVAEDSCSVAIATPSLPRAVDQRRQPVRLPWKPDRSRRIEVKAAVRAIPTGPQRSGGLDADVEPATTHTCTPLALCHKAPSHHAARRRPHPCRKTYKHMTEGKEYGAGVIDHSEGL